MFEYATKYCLAQIFNVNECRSRFWRGSNIDLFLSIINSRPEIYIIEGGENYH